ncbi:Uncharacterized protein Adt_42775 [Abeliophyllum distichum]|uniref:NADH-ubiquinone oxidoreductase 21kDa subunit N-terminal domain-containing protein n=1 Tax=Abeliophyllum distichum TaxID=126358 RepID=A0ABD1PSL5_9LAMI
MNNVSKNKPSPQSQLSYISQIRNGGFSFHFLKPKSHPIEKTKRKMNTDITASAKPEYPVIDRNPPFTKTVANFNTLDYLRLTTITGVSVVVGYLSGIKPGIRGPSMVTGGLIGVMGGFMYAYQNSAGRLMGFFPNEGEVAKSLNSPATKLVGMGVNMEFIGVFANKICAGNCHKGKDSPLAFKQGFGFWRDTNRRGQIQTSQLYGSKLITHRIGLSRISTLPIPDSPANRRRKISGNLTFPMETISVNSPILAFPSSKLSSRRGFTTKQPQNYGLNSSPAAAGNHAAENLRSISRSLRAVGEVSAITADPVQAEITWQTVVGALAGVTPFVVAGIEFSKRIVAQRKCKVCGGSGLVLRDKKYYFRCPGCGGFLPWQSWRRFFTG